MSDSRRVDDASSGPDCEVRAAGARIDRLRSLLDLHGIAIPPAELSPPKVPPLISRLKTPEKIAPFRSLVPWPRGCVREALGKSRRPQWLRAKCGVHTGIICNSAVLLFSAALGAAQPSSTGPDACSILSRQDVQHALKIWVGDGRPRVRTENVTSCSFPTRDGEVSLILRRNVQRVWIEEQERRMNGAGESSRFGRWPVWETKPTGWTLARPAHSFASSRDNTTSRLLCFMPWTPTPHYKLRPNW